MGSEKWEVRVFDEGRQVESLLSTLQSGRAGQCGRGWWWLAVAGGGTCLQVRLVAAAASNLQTRFSDSVVMLPSSTPTPRPRAALQPSLSLLTITQIYWLNYLINDP